MVRGASGRRGGGPPQPRTGCEEAALQRRASRQPAPRGLLGAGTSVQRAAQHVRTAMRERTRRQQAARRSRSASFGNLRGGVSSRSEWKERGDATRRRVRACAAAAARPHSDCESTMRFAGAFFSSGLLRSRYLARRWRAREQVPAMRPAGERQRTACTESGTSAAWTARKWTPARCCSTWAAPSGGEKEPRRLPGKLCRAC